MINTLSNVDENKISKERDISQEQRQKIWIT